MIKIFSLALLVLLVNCQNEALKNQASTTFTNSKEIGSWKLTGLVGISDETKYLNSMLQLSADGKYSFTNSGNRSVTTGTATYSDSTKISLDKGLFELRAMEFNVIKLSNTTLWLEEHYTLDNKNAYIEYHWTKQ